MFYRNKVINQFHNQLSIVVLVTSSLTRYMTRAHEYAKGTCHVHTVLWCCWLGNSKSISHVDKKESCAIAREPHDAAAVRFGLVFADIHYKLAKLRKPGQVKSSSLLMQYDIRTLLQWMRKKLKRETVKKHSKPTIRFHSSRHNRKKTEFNVKWPFKVIQGDIYWHQRNSEEGVNNNT